MTPTPGKPPVIGIAGWKKSGKTTLVTRLVEEFSRRGFRVATVKHAHHDFQIDAGETDSARHRRAGASQVAIVSSSRCAVVTEFRGAPEPALETVIAGLAPCDLVIVEGYKASAIPKIEARRLAAVSRVPLADGDGNFVAIAADHEIEAPGVPVFALDDVKGIAGLIERLLTLRSGTPS
jgi:molybdopterin-guanine dinucleotide biosynthesis protein B